MLETPFSCSLCHKEFAQLQALGNHVETIHVQLKQPEEKSREIDVANPKENILVDEQKNVERFRKESSDCEEIKIQTQADKEEDQIKQRKISKQSIG